MTRASNIFPRETSFLIKPTVSAYFLKIEEKRKEHANEREINITEIASKEDEAVNKFVAENEDFKAIAARIMTDAEAVKAVKSFIEFYEQQKNN